MDDWTVQDDPLYPSALASGVPVHRATSHDHLVQLTLAHYRDLALVRERSEVARHLAALRAERREIGDYLDVVGSAGRRPAAPVRATRAGRAIAKLREVFPRRIGETSKAWMERAQAAGAL